MDNDGNFPTIADEPVESISAEQEAEIKKTVKSLIKTRKIKDNAEFLGRLSKKFNGIKAVDRLDTEQAQELILALGIV